VHLLILRNDKTLGYVAFGLAGAISEAFGNNNKISVACGLVILILTHYGINNSNAAKAVQKAATDTISIVTKKNQPVDTGELLADAETVKTAFVTKAL